MNPCVCSGENPIEFAGRLICETCMAPVTPCYLCEPEPLCSCQHMIVQGEIGNTCVSCGIVDVTEPIRLDENTYPRGYFVTYKKLQPYTRIKRFKKYLMKACMAQSLSSIPDTTWEYLSKKQPFSGPAEILFTLKRSKLKNKCYDSLPLLTRHLCTHIEVPVLTPDEIKHSMQLFIHLDKSFPKKTRFISYLFLLEYILSEVGRTDMLPFLNRIQCPRRRRMYVERIKNVMNNAEQRDPDGTVC